MDSNKNEHDDLTTITGIGPARQRWLRESFGVRTFQDLADLSVDQIEAQLKADGQIPSRDAIVSWLLQAHELAASAPQPLQPDGDTTDENQIEANTSAIVNSMTRENGWKPFASFVIEFQTRETQPDQHRTAVHHIEQDAGKEWSGIEGEELCRWILEQIRKDVALEPADTGPAPAQPAGEPTRLEVSEVRVFQPPDADTPSGLLEASQPYRGTFKGSEPFTLEVSFGLTGETAAELTAKQATCLVQSFAYDEATHSSIQLGETAPTTLEEERYAYTLTLPEASLQPGTYRMWVTVAVENARAVPDFIEVPVLQVTTQ
jgi:hypothetical protein